MFENIELEYSQSCPVCFELLYEPYRTGPCSHVFCKLCIIKVEEMSPFDTKCPYCRQPVIYYQYDGLLANEIEEKYPEWYCYKRKNDTGSKNVPWLAFDLKVILGYLLLNLGLLSWFDQVAIIIIGYFPIMIYIGAMIIKVIIQPSPIPIANNIQPEVPSSSRNQNDETERNS